MVNDRTEHDRAIAASGLSRLLATFNHDVERGGEEFERLRRSLVKFFDWRGARAPQECADEVLDRLERELEETSIEDVWQHARSVARLVLLERRRRPAQSPHGNEDAVATAQPPSPRPESERLRVCVERCLGEFPAEDRSLVLGYYEGDRSARVVSRRHVAEAFGLSDNALRSRVQQLRNRLERCVQTCVSREDDRDS